MRQKYSGYYFLLPSPGRGPMQRCPTHSWCCSLGRSCFSRSRRPQPPSSSQSAGCTERQRCRQRSGRQTRWTAARNTSGINQKYRQIKHNNFYKNSFLSSAYHREVPKALPTIVLSKQISTRYTDSKQKLTDVFPQDFEFFWAQLHGAVQAQKVAKHMLTRKRLPAYMYNWRLVSCSFSLSRKLLSTDWSTKLLLTCFINRGESHY